MGRVQNSKQWHDEFGTWQERNAFLFNNKLMSDCSFIIDEGDNCKIQIPAHKYILGGFNVDFYQLFYLMEADSSEIPITDVTVGAFKLFLKYVYTGKTNLTMLYISDVLKLMKRFSTKCFKNYCEEYLIKQLNVTNYNEIMEISKLYGMKKLLLKCKSFKSSADDWFYDVKHIFLTIILVFVSLFLCKHFYLMALNYFIVKTPEPQPEPNLMNCIYNLVK